MFKWKKEEENEQKKKQHKSLAIRKPYTPFAVLNVNKMENSKLQIKYPLLWLQWSLQWI